MPEGPGRLSKSEEAFSGPCDGRLDRFALLGGEALGHVEEIEADDLELFGQVNVAGQPWDGAFRLAFDLGAHVGQGLDERVHRLRPAV
jgi:hypothetical protein